MNRYKLSVIAFLMFSPMAIQAQPQVKSIVLGSKDGLKIVVRSLDINDEALKLVYEIRNNSEEDVWIFAGINFYSPGDVDLLMNADVFMAEDGHTLIIRRRLDLRPDITGYPYHGRYVRLRPGERRNELIFIKVPVHPVSQFERARRQGQGLEYATRVAIELGYYTGNLPDMILRMHEGNKKSIRFFGFIRVNEGLISRDDEILVCEGHGIIKSEQALRTIVYSESIPYIEKYTQPIKLAAPDLTSCTKVEIQYQPSMLEYFFPYASQQSLLSRAEMEYLKSRKNLVLENTQQLETFALDVGKAKSLSSGFFWYIIGGCIRYKSKVNVSCYYLNKPPKSFSIYDDNTIVTKEGRLRSYKGFPSLRILTPQVQAIDLRMQCARNLKNLWHRFRIYYKIEASRVKDSTNIIKEAIYPSSNKWCDSMLQPLYQSVGIKPPLFVSTTLDKKIHICPSAGEGKNHYAMNLNCKPDSPDDMVLLFETKAGWNQHGGPELFTFYNHEPKGGCVLLNDGTVKFIRTKEKLQQLRWN